jgi:chromosome segregation ATPase
MNATLVERLRERSESYMTGGPSSSHTSALLDEAAARIAELEAERSDYITETEALVIRVRGENAARIAELEAANKVCHTDIEALMRSADSLEARNTELEAERNNYRDLNENLIDDLNRVRAGVWRVRAGVWKLEAERDKLTRELAEIRNGR